MNRIQPAPAPAVEPPATPDASDTPGAAVSSTVLLSELKSVIFISRPEQLTEAKARDGALDTSRIPLLDNETFRNRMEPYLGEPLRQSGIKRLLTTINLFYAANDKPFVSASVPAQEVTDGVLRILVVEGRVEQVKVEGNRYFSDEQYLAALGLHSGDPLQKSQLDSNIAWIDRNPFRAATIVATPGEAFGGTNLIVRANERYPVRAYASADNTGSPNTGEERLGVGVNWGNAFGLGRGSGRPSPRRHHLQLLTLVVRPILTPRRAAAHPRAAVNSGGDSAGYAGQTATSPSGTRSHHR